MRDRHQPDSIPAAWASHPPPAAAGEDRKWSRAELPVERLNGRRQSTSVVVVDSRSRPRQRRDKGRAAILQKRVAAMSDTQLTTIARLDERLAALKERL